MSDTPTLSVIIPSYTLDRYDQLCRLLKCIKNQTFGSIETIIVVENCSSLFQHICKFIEQEHLSAVRIIQTYTEIGSSFQVNLGVSKAKGDIIAFLHDDTLVPECWAENLVADYSEDDNIIGVTGPIVPSGRMPEWFPEEFDWIIGCNRYFVSMIKEKKGVRSISGSNASFRKKLFQAVGGLSITLGPLSKIKSRWCEIGEETELCLRLSRRFDGYILYDPEVVVYHDIPQENLKCRFIARMSFQGGRTKGSLKKFYSANNKLLAPEKEIFTKLWVTVIPEMSKQIFTDPTTNLRKTSVIFFSLSFIAFGYLLGYLAPSSLISKDWYL